MIWAVYSVIGRSGAMAGAATAALAISQAEIFAAVGALIGGFTLLVMAAVAEAMREVTT